MPLFKTALVVFCLLINFSLISQTVRAAEDQPEPVEDLLPAQKAQPANSLPSETAPKKDKREKKEKRFFGTEKEPRIDAGVFNVAFAVGGNFFMEPKLFKVNGEATGEYFNDFGFGGGVFFDYDYSQMTENIPLMLRGFVGYRYILQSVHVFDVEGIVRRMWQFSEASSFGIGVGVSSALWYRSLTDNSPYEETLFLPSMVVETGFEFNPMMVQLKWLVNRLGSDSSINGIEFMFGIRL